MLLLAIGCVHTPPSPSPPTLVGADVLYFDLEGTDRIDLLESCIETCPRDEAGEPVGSVAWHRLDAAATKDDLFAAALTAIVSGAPA